jgi:tRNA A58 N-methylase Trm61
VAAGRYNEFENLRKAGGELLVSYERRPDFAEIARQNVSVSPGIGLGELAGALTRRKTARPDDGRRARNCVRN